MKKNKFLFSILLVLSLFGCGTDTGNPTMNMPMPVNSSQPLSTFVAANLCSKISSCFSVTPNNCTTQVNTAALVSTHLGVNEAVYPNILAIQDALDRSTLSMNSHKANLCLQQIFYASCSDPAVQDSFDVSQPNDISRIWRLLNLETNCSQFIF